MSAGSTLPAGLGSAAELTSLSLLPLWDQVLRQPGKGRAALPPRQGLSLFKTRRKSAPPEHGRLPQMLRRKTSAALLQDLLDPKLRKTPAGPNRALIRLAGSLVKSLDEGLVVAFLTESASRKIPSPSRLLSEELLELAQVAQSLRLGARGDTLLALALARPRTKVKRTPSQTLLSSLLLIGPGIPADQSQKRSVHPEQFGATLAHLFGLRGVRGLAPLLPGLFK